MSSSNEVPYTMVITGMSCDACRRRVERALRAVPGVAFAEVSLAGGTATVHGVPGLGGALVAAAASAGYGAEVAPGA